MKKICLGAVTIFGLGLMMYIEGRYGFVYDSGGYIVCLWLGMGLIWMGSIAFTAVELGIITEDSRTGKKFTPRDFRQMTIVFSCMVVIGIALVILAFIGFNRYKISDELAKEVLQKYFASKDSSLVEELEIQHVDYRRIKAGGLGFKGAFWIVTAKTDVYYTEKDDGNSVEDVNLMGVYTFRISKPEDKEIYGVDQVFGKRILFGRGQYPKWTIEISELDSEK